MSFTPHGFPLFNRERNLRHAVLLMKNAANDHWDAEPLPANEANDALPDSLELYADLIETLLQHGTRGYYVNGCRCEWCMEAMRQHERRRKGLPMFEFTLKETE